MRLKIVANPQSPPIGALIAAEIIKASGKGTIEIEYPQPWNLPSNVQLLADSKVICEDNPSVGRYLARTIDNDLYGGVDNLSRTEVDSWISFGLGPLQSKKSVPQALEQLNTALSTRTWLACKRLTLADIYVFAALRDLAPSITNGNYNHISRWYNHLASFPFNANLPKVQAPVKSSGGGRKVEGKFIELPGAEHGKLVVRFPPEASGYLHIGHAKAALLNQYYADNFAGQLIMRFDDTNPAKENVDFEKAILEDLELLQIKPDRFTHSSDYFELMLTLCEKLINSGKAYVDDTPAETMKTQREQRLPSTSRDNNREKNLKLWQQMKDGTEKGQQCCVRAKIDYQSTNGCMRDPTIYRCKPEPHPKTGTKYKVYPTYDFTCPIVDSVEGVTHTLRTTEYHDRDDQFFWFIDALELRKPYIWEYSRLNMTNTVLSKRKLTWFVDNNIVDGWDDPRFPTVRGILRRGMTVEGLKQFIIAQGSSRTVVFMEWDKIWAFNKKVIDPIAVRYTGLDAAQLVPVYVEGIDEPVTLTVQNHPKDSSLGTKTVYTSKKVLIEKEDAEFLKVGRNATFINWGNLMINEVVKKGGNIVGVKAKLNLENKDFKGTVKLTWLADDSENETGKKVGENIKCIATYFGHIITKPVLAKDDDFKDFVAKDTKKEVMLLGEPELKRVKKGEIIQIQRKGFFRCDVPYSPLSDFSSREQPLILFHVPDGHATPSPAPAPAQDAKASDKKPQSTQDLQSIVKKIEEQGNKVRELKSAKADKTVLDTEVKQLLSLKASYKTITGTDWKPTSVSTAAPNPTVTEESLSKQIVDQGDKIRSLKSAKSDKKVIEVEVKILLGLKESYKNLTNTDWKPATEQKPPVVDAETAESLNKKIVEQGNKVRDLKSAKSDKKVIEEAVKILLGLKESYKNLTNTDWKPTSQQKPPTVNAETAESLNKKIVEQGNKVRDLKSAKSEKKIIESEVKILLDLKNTYKNLFNIDWKPASTENASTMSQNTEESLNKKITEQGDKVRALKATKPDKKVLDDEIKVLVGLKEEFKALTNKEWKPATAEASSKSKKPKAPAPVAIKPAEPSKTGTRLGLEAKKSGNLSDWYSQVITKGEMIEYYDVSGCYILRPWSYSIWDMIKDFFDGEIKKLGVQNCYFPIFVSRSVLEREKTHIADFAPEVAWVTKSGDSELAEPIAIRPTSETVMYPAYAKWVKSHRDLPLKLNQWNNVVRWEFKHPQPFLRTREFLWQEGHSAFLTKPEADEEVLAILELYARVYEEFLAIPVVRGRKTEKEKFAGGDYTTTVEAFVSASGRAIQGATSHHLGQNFSKMFDIQVEGAEEGGEKTFVYQNSWGITTRTIGVMVMVHGDDKGLVLPPKVASVQVVLVPCGITATTTPQQREKLFDECRKLESELNKESSLRVKADYRDNYSPGWKFNHWELKGVPVRVELGFKDLEKNQVTLVRRDTAERLTAKRNEIKNFVEKLLDQIQKSMYDKADADLKSHIKRCDEWKNFCQFLDAKNMLLVPFCGEIECEDKIKADSTREDAGDEPGAPSMGAKSLCIPFEQPKDVSLDTLKCIHPDCSKKPKFYTLFGRSY